MSSEQSRKVLEDIQRAKSKLLKDGAAASLGIGISSYASSSSVNPPSSSSLSPGGTLSYTSAGTAGSGGGGSAGGGSLSLVGSGGGGGSSSPASSSDVHMSPAMRSANLVLQQANVSSFGYFVAQDSHFGNSILPVLPRLEPPPGSVPATTTSGATTVISSSSASSTAVTLGSTLPTVAIKTEKC